MQFRAHKSLPLAPILNQINPVYKLLPSLLKIHFNIIPTHMSRDYKWYLTLSFPIIREYECLISSMCVICPAHLILLKLITLIIFSEEYICSKQEGAFWNQHVWNTYRPITYKYLLGVYIFEHNLLYNLDTDRVEDTPSNGSSTLARSFEAAHTCLPRRCLAMAASSCQTIPVFSRHITI
jgi:hypothetical protein